MREAPHERAVLEVHEAQHCRVTGPLVFSTVTALLSVGNAAIAADRAGVIDLGGVTASDSSGLALLVEWLSVARSAGRQLRYENMPPQLQQLARLSEVEDLFDIDHGFAPAPEAATPGPGAATAPAGSSRHV